MHRLNPLNDYIFKRVMGEYNGLRKLDKNFLKDNEPDIIKSQKTEG